MRGRGEGERGGNGEASDRRERQISPIFVHAFAMVSAMV